MTVYDIIITGSEGKIGKMLVPELTEAGYSIKRLDMCLGDDLKEEAYVKEVFKYCRATCLVNLFALNDHVSQGTAQAKTIYDFLLPEIDNYLHTNVTTLFSVCRAFAKHNSNSSIVNFSSIYGVRAPKPDLYEGSLKHIGYPISKAAVISLGEYLAICLAPSVRVNTVVPGGIYSAQPDDFTNRYSARCPMGRMGTPKDLIGVIKLLASAESSYITGSTLTVDGGWLL